MTETEYRITVPQTTLTPGEYELWRSVGKRHANGMVATLTIG